MRRIVNLYKRFGGTDLVREYLRTGFLFKAPFLLISTGISNKGLELFREAASLATYKFLRKKFGAILTESENCIKSVPQIGNKRVWMFWWQGMEHAPSLVKQCYQSVCNQLCDWEIILITENNYRDYVAFPQFILEKLQAGTITLTHFSDLLRIELLIKYGGLWLDATVLCTSSNIPKVILDSDLFVYQTLKPGANGHIILMSSWCMWAKSNNKILTLTRRLLYAYWERYNYMMDYFLLHQFFTLACHYLPEEARKIPPYTNESPHILLLHFFEPYRENLWEDWRLQTCFHKLSYKLPTDKQNMEGTFYSKIVNTEI